MTKNKFISSLVSVFFALGLVQTNELFSQETDMNSDSGMYLEIGFGYQKGLGKYSIKEYQFTNKYKAYNLQFALMREMGQERNWALGMGVGLRGFSNPVANTLPTSFFLQFKPLQSITNIKALVSLGYSFGYGDTFEQGFMSNIGVQWNPRLGKKSRLGLNAGYAVQELKDRPLIIFTPTEVLRFEENIYINLFYVGLSYRIF